MDKNLPDVLTDDVLINAVSVTTYLMLIITSILFTRYWINAKRESDKVAKSGGRPLPGPWGLPVFGSMLSLDPSGPHLSLMKLAKVYGHVFKIQMGSRPVLVLNGLKAIRNALVKQAVVFAGRPDLLTLKAINSANLFGPSLSFSQYSEEWKLHRKITETSLRHFTAGSQVPFVESVAKGEAEELVRYLKVPKCERSVDIPCLVRLSVSNLMLWFMFRKRASYDDKKFIESINILDGLSEAGSGNLVDFLPWLRFFSLDSSTGFLEAQKRFNKSVRGLIDERHELYDPESAQHVFMDEIIALGHVREEDEFQRLGLAGRTVLQNAFDFFGAGLGTTSATLEWAMVHMALFPKAQYEVQCEIDKVVGRDRLPTLNDREYLPLTQSCLLEIQRYAAVTPFGIPHSTTKDTILDGYFVPKDMVVFVNLYSANFDPEVWDEPEVFNPRRFLAQDGALDDEKMKLLKAFGLGRRRCVGSGLASINLFIYFSTLLHQLRFSCPEGGEVNLEFRFGITLHPKNLNVHIESR
eukprot:XP_003730026.1 PREDICTED: cytochrome P450 1A5-like [Strongylocentrotus purpuratus]